MAGEKILISGAGIAGSILAYWLAKHDFTVTVVERSKSDQKLGQGIEIEEPALQVVQAMGILERIQAIRTGEQGFELVDTSSRVWARFDADGGEFSPTGSLEVMRGDLAEVLYKAADESPNVTYLFETTISSLTHTEDEVIVELEDRQTKKLSTHHFDLLIGADGTRSRTRQLLFGPPEEIDCFKPVGAFTAYCSIPRAEQDWPLSRMCHFPGRRVIWTRPVNEKSDITSVYMIHLAKDVPALRRANAAGDRQKQKQIFAELYANDGWDAPRVIKGMLEAENFYSDEYVQVKLPKWSKDRVALVGDAAWAPTPFTGQGNQLAIIGGFVLAQELSRNRNVTAFENYEKRLRDYVEKCQAIPFGGYGPTLCVPETSLGIFAFRSFLGIVAPILRILSHFKFTAWIPEVNDTEHFDLEIPEEWKAKT